MADEKPKQNIAPPLDSNSPWKVPGFTGLDRLHSLMEKIMETQIELSKEKIQNIQRMLEVKRRLDHKFPRDKK